MYIKVRVKAGAKLESFVQKSATGFEVSVKEKAERNMANGRVLELVARHFKVVKGKVRLVNGHHSPSKMLHVENGL